MVNACADPDFFCQKGGGGRPSGEKTALIFLCLFWGFLVQNFPGMRGGGGPTIYGGGGGGPNANFYRICDLPGMGSGPPTPPPPLDPHMHDI